MNPSSPAARPRSTIARRVLATFAITVVAFAVTLGWGIAAQRRAAEDSVELGRGYVPVAMRLAQLRAAQTTLSTLVDGIPDEREPGSTRVLLETLVGARRTMFVETRVALTQTLPAVGSDTTRALATELWRRTSTRSRQGSRPTRPLFERLFAAIASGDRDGVNRTIVSLGAVEHDADRRLRVLAGRVGGSIDELSSAARDRELRSIWALAVLAALTLAVGRRRVAARAAPARAAGARDGARAGRRARRPHARGRSSRATTRSDSSRARSRRWSRGSRARRSSRSRTSGSPRSARWPRT